MVMDGNTDFCDECFHSFGGKCGIAELAYALMDRNGCTVKEDRTACTEEPEAGEKPWLLRKIYTVDFRFGKD